MLYDSIANYFSQYSDVLYGFAKTEYSHFNEEYKTALVFVVPHSFILEVNTYREELLEKYIVEARSRIEKMMLDLENIMIEQKEKYFIPNIAQNPEDKLYLAPFSFKFAAVHAGLGWIGKNDLLVTEEYGPRVRLAAILIEEELPGKEPVTQSKCPEECEKCVSACPYGAIAGTMWNIETARKDMINYELCDMKRSLFIKEHGRKNSCGICMVACPIGAK